MNQAMCPFRLPRAWVTASVISAAALFLSAGCDDETTNPAADRIPPAAIRTLQATGGPGIQDITLTWTAVGDDSLTGTAARYELRRYGRRVTAANWDSAGVVPDLLPPKTAGHAEVFSVTGLDPGLNHYFAMRVADEAGNWSPLSNCAAAELDTIPPDAVSDLAISPSTLAIVVLTWTAVGDDGRIGRASAYDVRSSRRPITSESWDSATPVEAGISPSVPGTPQTLELPVDRTFTVYFAVRVADERGQWSAVSNCVEAASLQSSPGACLRTLRGAYVERSPDVYRRLFAESFTFVFSPEDVASEDPTPVSWSLSEELVSAGHLLRSEAVDRIDLTFIQSDTVNSGNEYPDTWKVRLNEVQLRVYTSIDGEPFIYLVPNGFAAFYLRKIVEPQTGDIAWQIVRWEDMSVRVETTTWGRIKNLFR